MTNMKQTVISNPSWWRRRTGLERVLTLTTACGALAVLALVISLCFVLLDQNAAPGDDTRGESLPQAAPSVAEGRPPGSYIKEQTLLCPQKTKSPNDDTSLQQQPEICMTPGCIKAANRIIQSMDRSVEPCDDFYRFACGSFLKETVIPDDKVSVNTFSMIGDKLQVQLRAIVETPSDREKEPEPFTLAKDLYKSCMNKSLIESRGTAPLLAALDRLGGWPVLVGPQWDQDTAPQWTWDRSVRQFRRAGYSMDYFVDFSISTDFKNSTQRVIDLDQAILGLSREYLIKGFSDRIVSAYSEYMVDIAVMLGAPRERAEKELKESLLFEMRLANISLPTEKRRNATILYNPHTISELQRKFPLVPDWTYYINALLPEGLQINQDEVVVVNVPSYLLDLAELLKETPKRVQANYALWRVTSFSVFFLTEDLRKRQLSYATALSGRTEQESRWKECVDLASGSLPIALGSLYVRKHFNEAAKRNALEMVTGIREQFAAILAAVDWMDAETRAAALEKAEGMTAHIAYPDEILDDQKLIEYYKGLTINPSEYMESVLGMNVFMTDFAFNKLRKPVNKTAWETHARPAIVNAFYSAIENSIQFPAGILQEAFFDADRPRYMNYGAIGFVIGHEITHGFDDQGRQFDKQGNLVDWWAPQTKEAYLKKARCIIEQYGNYTERSVGLKLNGINTQGENIADNGGIKEAYLAYVTWAERQGHQGRPGHEEPRLPGLTEYTPRQMFWLSAANTWCSKYRPESIKMRITTGAHSPGEFRVLGPMSNMEDFARDFQCPQGSVMNPVHKCSVW